MATPVATVTVFACAKSVAAGYQVTGHALSGFSGSGPAVKASGPGSCAATTYVPAGRLGILYSPRSSVGAVKVRNWSSPLKYDLR